MNRDQLIKAKLRNARKMRGVHEAGAAKCTQPEAPPSLAENRPSPADSSPPPSRRITPEEQRAWAERMGALLRQKADDGLRFDRKHSAWGPVAAWRDRRTDREREADEQRLAQITQRYGRH